MLPSFSSLKPSNATNSIPVVTAGAGGSTTAAAASIATAASTATGASTATAASAAFAGADPLPGSDVGSDFPHANSETRISQRIRGRYHSPPQSLPSSTPSL